MVSVIFRLRYDDHPKMLIEISREFQVPTVPRKDETVYFGTEKLGDYFGVEQVWHFPVKGEVHVEFHCELWVLLETWKSADGWKITESSSDSEEKFLRLLEHPEELGEE